MRNRTQAILNPMGPTSISWQAFVAVALMVGPVEAAESVALEEVLVTAARREASLQDTPISVTAISADLLEQNNIRAIRGIGKVTPGITFSALKGLEAPVTIRGISSGAIGPGGESPVAVYVDGVFLSQPHSSTFALPDVERIEVLRGPQGTLYGQSTTAGAIKVTTEVPTNERKAMAAVEFGSLDLRESRFALSGPIVEDRLLAKLSATQRDVDGYYDNYYTGHSDGDASELSVNGAINWLPENGLDLMLRADWSKSDRLIRSKILSADNPLAGPPIPCPTDCDYTFTNGRPVNQQDIESRGISLTVKWETSFADISSITAARELEWFFLIDNSWLDYESFPVQNEHEQSQFSQEFNLTSNGSGPLQWVAGLYYFTEQSDMRTPLAFIQRFPDMNGDGLGENLTIHNWSDISADTLAAYGEMNYQLTERMRLTVGGRYGSTKRQLIKDQLVLTPFDSPATQLSPQPSVVGAFRDVPPISEADPTLHLDREETWDYFVPRVLADYQFSDDVLAYASVSTGYKAGGFDFNAINPGPFEEEDLMAYEIGFKSEWFDRRMRVNGSFYYYDYTNLQQTIQDSTGQRQTVNAADAKIHGAEIELFAILGDGFNLRSFVAYNSNEFENFSYDVSEFGNSPAENCLGGYIDPAAPTDCNLSGNRTPNSPEWVYSIALDKEFRVGDFGSIIPQLSYYYRSETFFSIQNTKEASFESAESLDARIVFTSDNELWTLAVYGKNLTDDRYTDGGTTSNAPPIFNPDYFMPGGSGRQVGSTNPPRNYGVSITYRL